MEKNFALRGSSIALGCGGSGYAYRYGGDGAYHICVFRNASRCLAWNISIQHIAGGKASRLDTSGRRYIRGEKTITLMIHTAVPPLLMA